MCAGMHQGECREEAFEEAQVAWSVECLREKILFETFILKELGLGLRLGLRLKLGLR